MLSLFSIMKAIAGQGWIMDCTVLDPNNSVFFLSETQEPYFEKLIIVKLPLLWEARTRYIKWNCPKKVKPIGPTRLIIEHKWFAPKILAGCRNSFCWRDHVLFPFRADKKTCESTFFMKSNFSSSTMKLFA